MGQKKLKVVAVAGSVNRPSKTLALVEQILHTLAEAHPIQARVVELGAIAPHLGSAVYPGGHPNSPTDGHLKLPHLS